MTKECLQFLGFLHANFELQRKQILFERTKLNNEVAKLFKPFTELAHTNSLRQHEWKVGKLPKQLEKRWMEITGPPTRKLIINALNSGAQTFMADMEDSLSPTWDNIMTSHKNMILTCNKKINFYDGETKKMYKLKR